MIIKNQKNAFTTNLVGVIYERRDKIEKKKEKKISRRSY
jgi:hypothetical protein